MDEIELRLFDHILLFLLGIVLPFFAVFQSQPGMKKLEFDTSMKKQVYYGNSIFQWICTFIVVLVWWLYGRSFATLGIQPGVWTFPAFLMVLVFILLYSLDVWWGLRNKHTIRKTKERWLKDIPILPVNREEFRHFLFVAFTAGVCEEIIFRGFFIHYFLALNTDNLLGNWLAICIPAFLFAVGHMYQGGKAVAKTMLMAILFGWIFLLTRSLLTLMLIHFLVDVIGGYLAFQILKTNQLEE